MSGAKGSYRLNTPSPEQLGSWLGRQGGKKTGGIYAPARRRWLPVMRSGPVMRSLPVKQSLRCHTRRCAANRRFYRFPDRSAGSWLQEARLYSMASLSSPASPLTRIALGLAEFINHAFNHAFGNPREEGAHLPPPGGCKALPRPAAAPLPLSSASAPIPRPSKLR